MTDDPRLTHRDSFRFLHTETIRYSDQDPQGHVNNVTFATFCESGRVAWSRHVITLPRDLNDGVVTAKLTLEFLHEMHYPGTVEIGTRLLAFGRSSMTVGQGLFQNGVCTGVATTVAVQFDLIARRSKPFSPEAIALLEDLLRADAMPAP